MEFNYNDGGRAKYFKGKTGDCVTRAIAIATEKDYLEVYNIINELAKKEKITEKKKKKSNARTGVYKDTYKKYLESLGWKWYPCMRIGSGCTTHLCKEELPNGTIICRLSRHLVCVKDGVINDTYDCSRGETRCVYGYFKKF
ncbi:MAG: hypothetical protein J6J36_03000 [Clostridia bacterium]|nr:hypothetical protein [Clostridia bacterium]